MAKALGHWDPDLWLSQYFLICMTTPPSRILYNHLATCLDPLSAVDSHVRCGSGTESKIALIKFCWPSGIVQTLTEMVADEVPKLDWSKI